MSKSYSLVRPVGAAPSQQQAVPSPWPLRETWAQAWRVKPEEQELVLVLGVEQGLVDAEDSSTLAAKATGVEEGKRWA